MSLDKNDLKYLILKSVGELPPFSTDDDDDNDDVHLLDVLLDLANNCTKPINKLRRGRLNLLSRKICFAKSIDLRYREGWKKHQEAEPATEVYWSLLTALFFQYASVFASNDKDGRGMSFKLLNSGLVAIDLMKELSFTSNLEELESISNGLLQKFSVLAPS